MEPLLRLFEREGLPAGPLPGALAAIYGGGLSLPRPGVVANFVSSVDAVVALTCEGESGHIISGADEGDRFIMGLLRATSDAVLIGAGTFRKAGGQLWHPEAIFPASRDHFATLRRQLGLRSHPLLVIVTDVGDIDPTQPALQDSLIITTPQGESRLRGRLPSTAQIAVFNASPISGTNILECLRGRGLQVILVEGVPTLMGQLLEESLIDELFLTTSPRLFGRQEGDGRKSLVEGVNLGGRSLKLLSVRGHESHLYLRYAV